MRLQALTACVLGFAALQGCGGDERPGTAPPTRTTADSGTSTATEPAGSGAATRRSAVGGPPAATAAEVAAIPAGLTPDGPAAEMEDPAVIDDLRARLTRSADALRRVGTARYSGVADLLGTRSRTTGRADFRTGESLGPITIGNVEAKYYNDGMRSYVKVGSNPRWIENTPLVPNAAGNAPRVYARNLRVGRAGAQQTIGGIRCRWAAGVIPFRQLLDSSGATDTPKGQKVIALSKPGAAAPTAVCVAEDGIIPAVRIDLDLGRDLGITGQASAVKTVARLSYTAFGRAPSIERPQDLPAN